MEIVFSLVNAVEKTYDQTLEKERKRVKAQNSIKEFEEKLVTPFVDDLKHRGDVNLGIKFEDFKELVFRTTKRDNPSIIENLDLRIISGWEVEEEVENKKGQVIGVNSYNITVALYSKYNCWDAYSNCVSQSDIKGVENLVVRKYNKDNCIGLRVKKICYSQVIKKMDKKKLFDDVDDVCFSKWNVSDATKYYLWNDQNPLDSSFKKEEPKFTIDVVGPKDNKPPVYYTVEVKDNSDKYKVERRYKQFAQMHEVLKTTKFEKDLPKFPEKLLLGNENLENLWYRTYLFRDYLKFIAQNEELLQHEAVKEFLKK